MPASNPPRPQKPAPGGKSIADAKPGSEPTKLNLPHDFGAPADDATERAYASQAVLNQDPGRIQQRSTDETDGVRQGGVMAGGQGAGASSGGDVDTDIIGLGTGRSLAASIPDKAEQAADGPDRTGGSAAVFASGKPAPRENQDRTHLTPLDNVPRGGTVTYDRDGEPGNIDAQGVNSIRMSAGDDDPYADAAQGDISRGDAVGSIDSSSSTAGPAPSDDPSGREAER